MDKNHKLLLVFSIILLFLCQSPVDAAVPGNPLKPGMQGTEVQGLQSLLKDYGYYDGDIDGIYGSDTIAAVCDFQTDSDLEPDGVVGFATLSALRDFRTSTPVNRGLVQSRTGVQIAAFARQYLGTPYVWAGKSPGGFDCSGFIYYIYRHFNITVPRMADEQFNMGRNIALNDLQSGDLVFFSTYEPGPSHVGIYIGSGQFIHASSGADEVTITPLSKAYYRERYLGARRLTK